MRIDKFLTTKYPDLSRAKIQAMIERKQVLVNGNAVKVSYNLREEDDVKVAESNKQIVPLPVEKFTLPILYEDQDLLVVDKPAGLSVHPSGPGMRGTLANQVVEKVAKGVGEELRPGIVHRIDKDTSGILLVARTARAYEALVEAFKRRKIQKKYLVMVLGILKHKEGIIESPIGRALKSRQKMRVSHIADGKEALSVYRVLREFRLEKLRQPVSLMEVEIKTGRTHQIRVHMAAIGYPVLGDDKYGNKKINRLFRNRFGLKRQFLQASEVVLEHPCVEKKMRLKAPLAVDLSKALEEIERKEGK